MSLHAFLADVSSFCGLGGGSPFGFLVEFPNNQSINLVNHEPKPEPVSDPEIVEVELEPVDELSVDGVHIDSLPDLEKETVLIRTAASIEIGERTIPPRAVGKVIEVTFDNQWLLRVETILNGSAITFIIPFSNCYLQNIST